MGCILASILSNFGGSLVPSWEEKSTKKPSKQASKNDAQKMGPKMANIAAKFGLGSRLQEMAAQPFSMRDVRWWPVGRARQVMRPTFLARQTLLRS